MCYLYKTFQGEISIIYDIRVSVFCSSWLYDNDGEAVAKVNARLGAVTQLDVSTAEGLQVGVNNVGL
jgi:hypothetical protein